MFLKSNNQKLALSVNMFKLELFQTLTAGDTIKEDRTLLLY